MVEKTNNLTCIAFHTLGKMKPARYVFNIVPIYLFQSIFHCCLTKDLHFKLKISASIFLNTCAYAAVFLLVIRMNRKGKI